MCALAVLAACRAAEEGVQEPPREATWSVAESPEVTIGQLDGAEEYLLANIVDGVLLGDRTVVVQNATASLFELRYFDASGQHLATASRWGEGPFEFQIALTMSRLLGDSVLVLGMDSRYAVFGSRGERVREGRIPGPVAGGLAYVIDAWHIGTEDAQSIGAPGPHTSREALIVRNLTGASDTIAVLNAGRVYLESRGSFYQGYGAPFNPTVFSAAGPGVYWFGTTEMPEVYGYRVNGNGMDTIRLSWAPTPVTGTDRERWLDSVASSGVRAFQVRGAEELGFPDSFPYWGALEVDHAGNVWVLRYEVPWTVGPQRWSVFSPLGEPIATVTIPRAIAPRCTGTGCRRELLDIGVDYVLLSRRGPLDVPQVHLHRLIKE